MSTNLQNVPQGTNLLEQVVIKGDLAGLSPNDRVLYYKAVCESIGLNPLTKPFDYIQLNGKLTLYAKKDCTEQLRKIYGISIEITSRELVEDMYIVSVRATDKSGRTDEAIGAICLGALKGEARANALMKAETKAKRRVTLSVCGLGMLDESEEAIQSISANDVSVEDKESIIGEGELFILRGKIKEAEVTEENICNVMQIDKLEGIPYKMFVEIMRRLEKQIKKKQNVDDLPINKALQFKEEAI